MRACELIPFQKAVQSHVGMILMAHLQVNAIDEEYPTTLGPMAYHFLRDELKYNGIIISDDMEMNAISDQFSWEDSAAMAFTAGCDILVYRSMARAQEAYTGLSRCIQDQKISQQKLCQKITRIMALKNKSLKNYRPISIPSIDQIFNSDESKHFFLELGEKMAETKTRK